MGDVVSDMLGRNRGGKAFLSVDDGDELLMPTPVASGHSQVACLAQSGRLLVFALDDGSEEGEEISPEVDEDWRPLAFSKNGSVGFGDLAFAGYGIVAPEDGDPLARPEAGLDPSGRGGRLADRGGGLPFGDGGDDPDDPFA